MFNKLKDKWKVSWLQFALIFSTFAFGGSLCSYVSKYLLSFTNIEKGTEYVLVYIVLATLVWPLCVLTISIPLGQFVFFKRYLIRIWTKISGKSS
jgi:hypothetical protein